MSDLVAHVLGVVNAELDKLGGFTVIKETNWPPFLRRRALDPIGQAQREREDGAPWHEYERELADRRRERKRDCLQGARARKGRTDKSRDIADIVYRHGRLVRLKSSAKPLKEVAREILDPVKKYFEEHGRKKPISLKTVKRHLEANWDHLCDSKPLTKSQLKLPDRLASRSKRSK